MRGANINPAKLVGFRDPMLGRLQDDSRALRLVGCPVVAGGGG